MHFNDFQNFHIVGYFFLFIIFTYFLSIIFRLFWNTVGKPGETPAGFGFVFSFILAVFFFIVTEFSNSTFYMLLVVLFGSLYFIDDVKTLTPLTRFALVLAFVVPSSFILDSQVWDNLISNKAIYIIFVFFIIFFFLNMVNFYDGSDLNVSVLIGLFSLNSLFLLPINSEIYFACLLFLGFIFGFGIVNRLPNTLYYGDSGAFVFSSFLYFLIHHTQGVYGNLNALLFIPLLLPAIDVSVTLFYRIWKKENIFSRHHHHLYQRLERAFEGRFYLWPQIVNFISCYCLIYFYPNLLTLSFHSLFLGLLGVSLSIFLSFNLLMRYRWGNLNGV